jgi:hypothetical protein
MVVKIAQDPLVTENAQCNTAPVLSPQLEEALVKLAGAFIRLGSVAHAADSTRSLPKMKKQPGWQRYAQPAIS